MRTIYKWLIALATMGVLVSVPVHSCAPTREELLRVHSPDGVVDAVLVDWRVDATVGTPFAIYIVPSGSGNLRNPVMSGDDFVELKLRWSAPRFLRVEFSKARIWEFNNFWEDRSAQTFRYVVPPT
jgi:hypothetical protein